MKITFWKHTSEIKIFLPSLGITSLSLIITGIILAIIKHPAFWAMFIMGGLSLLILLIVSFSEKRTFAKIVISSDGIEERYFKRKTTFLRWEDICEMKEIYRGRGMSWLSLISKENHIDVEVTQKMYNTIMLLCPYGRIKNQINSFQYYQWFQKRFLKKIDKTKEGFTLKPPLFSFPI